MFDRIKAAAQFLGDLREGVRQLATPPAAEWKRWERSTDEAVPLLQKAIRSAPADSALARIDPASVRRAGQSSDAYVEFRLVGEAGPGLRGGASATALKAALSGRKFEPVKIGAEAPVTPRAKDGFEP